MSPDRAMLVDYHMHTPLCKHAAGAPADYVAEAVRNGIEEICFTDHAPAPSGYDSSYRMALSQFADYRALVASAAPSGGCRILFGIEADYAEVELPFLRRWLPGQDFDLVLGSVHYLGAWGFDDPLNLAVWDTVNVLQVWRDYFQRVGELADTRLFDVLAHPDLPKKFGHRPAERDIRDMVQPALDKLAAAGMGIEISTAGLRKPVREIYPSLLILTLARDRDIPITFGSDAHAPQDVGYAFDQAVAMARRAGYAEFAAFAKRRRRSVPLPPA